MFQIQTPYFVSINSEDNSESHNNGNHKQKDKYETIINNILLENNQIRKKIPEGNLQIFKAISYSLFFTTNFDNSIQNACNQHLLFLIRYNNLNDKLFIFKNNMLLYRDFCMNPCQNQVFEKVSNFFLCVF